MQIEMKNDMNNIEKYVLKERENEQAYRDKFDVANKRMAGNANNLVNTS